jgi:peptidoglycan L-alanyl-D-glutamate endopeptidase CwlK
MSTPTPKPIPSGNPVPFAKLSFDKPVWPLLTQLSRKFEINYEDKSGNLVGSRPGRRFLADRQDGKRWHVGVDLFGDEGDEVVAIAEGRIISFYRFYTRKNGEETYAIFVEHDGVVINYGEVKSDAQQKYGWLVGDKVKAGQKIGQVSGTNMIHFETYLPGTQLNQSWMKNGTRPSRLLNPTQFLLDLVAVVSGQSVGPITPAVAKNTPFTLTHPRLSADPALAAVAAGLVPMLESRSSVRQQGVGLVQDILNELGVAAWQIDVGPQQVNRGIFGPKTLEAVKAFQTASGITKDGRIGPDTLRELEKKVSAGIPSAQPAINEAQLLDSPHDLPEPTPGSKPVKAETYKTAASNGSYNGNKSSTSGSTVERVTYDDGTVIERFVESISAERDGKKLPKKTATQIRVTKKDRTWVEMGNYCWNLRVDTGWPDRDLPVAELYDGFPGFPSGSGAETGKTTRFGKLDPIDEGTGSPVHGTVHTNSDVLAASVKKSRLERFFGLPWNQLYLRHDLLWSLRVEVFHRATKRFARVPLADVGPREDLPAELDLTRSLSDWLGGDGSDMMDFRLIQVNSGSHPLASLVSPMAELLAAIPSASATLDARSITNIATLHPLVQTLAHDLANLAAQAGITIQIISGSRTYAEQDALYAKGRTVKPIGKKHRVTNAKGGYSNHNFGIAFDVGVFEGASYKGSSPKYKAVGALGTSIGLDWGGNWKSFVDEPHFQVRPAWASELSERDMVTELRRRHKAGIGPFD